MPELYVKPSITEAFDLGKNVVKYGTDDEHGPIGIYTVDAALEFVQQAHALIRQHQQTPIPVFECGPGEATFTKLSEVLDQPQPVAASETGLDPASLLALYQAAKIVARMFGWNLPF